VSTTLQEQASQSLEKTKKKACFSGLYQFFDIFVNIKTNHQDILEGFHQIYWRFLRNTTFPKNAIVKDLYILSENPKLTVICENEFQVFENLAVTPNLYLFIFSFIIPKVKSHFLVHAATLSYNHKATVITAHSTSGKTTLAVELIKRGINFLSDELAPIHRNHHQIDPFTRSIGLRNVKIHGLEELAQQRMYQAPNAKGEIKWMIDPEDLRKGSVGDACACKNVIFLEPQYEEENSASDAQQILEICFTRVYPSLMEAIKRISGVKEMELVNDRMFPLLRLSVEKEARIIQDVEESSRVYQSAIVSVVNGKTQKPDFSMIPSLKPITKFEGTFELAKMMLNAHPEASLMDDFNQSPALLLSHLADITASFQFYKLMVGRLDLMAKMVEDLMKNGEN
jgi:hypothetical protein